jgi:cAMP-dependent protein kinase regulator
VGRLERLQAAEGAVVVEQGSAGDAMYMVSEGSVAVSHRPATGEPMELARLGPGAFFGEMALVSSAPRAAEVRAAEPSVLLRADKEEMDGLAAGAPVVGDVLIAFCHARMLENLVRVSPVLAPVPPLKRPEVIARFETDFSAAGEVIIAEGQEGPGLFLVVSGGVRVVRAEGSDRVLLASLGPGDLFGEISLLMRKPSTATVIAQQNTALLFLPRAQFESATSEFPELLKGAYDIAVSRENRNNSIMGKAALDASDLILV